MSQKTLNGREIDEAFAVFGPALVILAETAETSEPAEGALHDPSNRNDDKALGAVRTQRDFQVNAEGLLDPGLELRSFIATIGQDLFQAFPERFGQFLQQAFGAVAFADIRRMSNHLEQVAHNINGDVPFAPIDLLAAIKAVFAPDFRRLDTFAVDNRQAWLGFPACCFPYALAQHRVDLLPRAIPAPFPK